eukprot:8050478-Pyramimonas_sp.AAC.1
MAGRCSAAAGGATAADDSLSTASVSVSSAWACSCARRSGDPLGVCAARVKSSTTVTGCPLGAF